MSELKYYKLFHRASALTSPEFISVVEFGTDDKIYCKSEADKVIAELKAKNEWLEECGGDDLRKYIAHQKYKRCLAMANYWVAISYHCVDDKHRQRAEKHHYKWLELAEKFKEEENVE